ncbi:MAG TPA: hypothetical protein VFE42_26865 [Chloroflexota bacterium]|nr:hypothetical protein [Chloroflexota bacterium]
MARQNVVLSVVAYLDDASHNRRDARLIEDGVDLVRGRNAPISRGERHCLRGSNSMVVVELIYILYGIHNHTKTM